MDISSIVDAPAPPSVSNRANRAPAASSKDQKQSSMPELVGDLKDIAAAAFRQLPVTVPGETPATVVSRDSRQEPEPAPVAQPKRETVVEKSMKPDPKTRAKEEMLKSAQDVWSKVPAAVEPEKPVEVVPDKAVPAAVSEDPFAGVKDGDWKAAKAAAKARQEEAAKQIAEMKAEVEKRDADLARFRQAFPDPSEAEKVRAESKAALDRLALLDFQSHPDYRRQFIEPKQKIVESLKTILSENGVDGVDLEALVNKPRAEFAKAASEIQDKLNRFDAQEFHSSVRELSKLNEAGKAALGNSQQVAEDLRRQSEARARTAFEQAIHENKQWMLKPYDIPTGADPEEALRLQGFNKALEQVRSNAERYAFSPADDKTSATIAFKAAQFDLYTQHALPRMVKDYHDAKELIGQLSSELEQLKAKRPGIPDSSSQAGAGAEKKEEDLPFAERAKKLWAR